MNEKSFTLKGSLTRHNTNRHDDYIHSSDKVWQIPQDYKRLGLADMKALKNASNPQDHATRLERTINYYQKGFLKCQQGSLWNDLKSISEG